MFLIIWGFRRRASTGHGPAAARLVRWPRPGLAVTPLA